MVKDILIVADLGAAGNLLRNLLLLGKTDWPLKLTRLSTILNQYPPGLQLKDWLPREYKLRFWDQYYNLDMSNKLNFETFQSLSTSQTPRVWLNHTAFWENDQLEYFLNNCCVVYLSPATANGLEWQIRSYISKKTVELLHDFCFEDDREAKKNQYIQDYGANAYYLLNITNMKYIMEHRQMSMREIIPSDQCLDLEILLYKDAYTIQNLIQKMTGLLIPAAAIDQVITAWRNLHWKDTTDWEYHNIFQQ